MKAEITIINKDYNKQQQKLINIWEAKLKSFKDSGIDSGFVFLTKPATKTKSNKRRICGFSCELVSRDLGREIVKISTDKYILLMAKLGIEIKMIELKG